MKLCMIGTGYVGLVSGTCFSDLGNKVYCVDKNIDKIKKLNLSITPIYEPGLDELIKKNHSDGTARSRQQQQTAHSLCSQVIDRA